MTMVDALKPSGASFGSTETATGSGTFKVSFLSVSGSAASARASAIGTYLKIGAAGGAGFVGGFVVMGLAL
jgi:hypothetical protein